MRAYQRQTLGTCWWRDDGVQSKQSPVKVWEQIPFSFCVWSPAAAAATEKLEPGASPEVFQSQTGLKKSQFDHFWEVLDETCITTKSWSRKREDADEPAALDTAPIPGGNIWKLICLCVFVWNITIPSSFPHSLNSHYFLLFLEEHLNSSSSSSSSWGVSYLSFPPFSSLPQVRPPFLPPSAGRRPGVKWLLIILCYTGRGGVRRMCMRRAITESK